jgi:putative spermidine/putrescine transport system ATP-binding protein
MPFTLRESSMAVTAQALPVQIARITKTYGNVRAVDQVSLSVRAGEFVTLLGPSGSGKTTLLMMIAGFSRPDSGSIAIGGQEIVRLPPHKRNIGMVFQNYALFPHMSVGENIAYPLRLRGVSRRDAEERVARVLDLVQMPGYAGRRVDQLSGGQRQRVALARAVVFEPRILLMDEPLSALDKQLRERMQMEIRRLHNALGMTTIAVTHDQREALTMSDRIAVLNHGRLIQFAAPRDLYERPASRFVAEFIGESSFLPVEVDGEVARYAGRPLRLAEPPPRGGARLQLLMRPEKLELANGHGDDAVNRFEGRVADAVFQGDSVLLTVRLAGGDEVSARVPNRNLASLAGPEPGAPITLAIHAQDSRLVPEAP